MKKIEKIIKINGHPLKFCLIRGRNIPYIGYDYYLQECTLTRNDVFKITDGQYGTIDSDIAMAMSYIIQIHVFDCLNNTKLRFPTYEELWYAATQKNRIINNGVIASDVADEFWCEENSGNEVHAVKCFKPNKFGLYDIIGNLFQVVTSDANHINCFGLGYTHSKHYTLKKWIANAMSEHNIGLRLALTANPKYDYVGEKKIKNNK